MPKSRPLVEDVQDALSRTLNQEELGYVFGPEFEWHDESYLVQGIKRHLLTAEQRTQLTVLGLSIEDILNGRFGLAEEKNISVIFAAWNAKTGQKSFGF